MAKFSIVIVLFVAAFIMLKDFSATWQGKRHTIPPAPKSKVVESVTLPENAAQKPTAPAILPDLKPGYLFNTKRTLVVDPDEKVEEPQPENQLLRNDLGIDVKIDELLYSGSIIGDTFSRAIVAYPPPPKKRRNSKSSRTSRSRSEPRRSSSRDGSLKHAQLKKGDVLNGYVVAEILPDKIIFDKDGDIVEKFLNDPSKKRVVSKNTPRRAAPARKVAPPAVSRTTQPPQPATAQKSLNTAAPGAPVKKSVRKVVSRKAPSKPNTSRVSRRRRSSGRSAVGGTAGRGAPGMPPMPPMPSAPRR